MCTRVFEGVFFPSLFLFGHTDTQEVEGRPRSHPSLFKNEESFNSFLSYPRPTCHIGFGCSDVSVVTRWLKPGLHLPRFFELIPNRFQSGTRRCTDF